MIQLRHRQPSLWHSGLAKDIEDLWEPWMKEVDQLLEDAALVESVYDAQGKRHPKSRTRGRTQTPAEVALRLLILKHVRNWSYDTLEREVRANLVYRALTRIGDEKVPDAKTLARLGQAIGPEVIGELHERLMELARERGVVQGRKMRVDTTVVETNVHYPTDSSLLGDGARVLTRTMKKVEKAAGGLKKRIRDRMRSVNKKVIAIALAGRLKRSQGEERRVERYRELVSLTRKIVRQAEGVLEEMQHLPRRRQAQLARLREILETMAGRVRQVVRQTEARVFQGITKYPHKIVSLFEPHTEIIRKGKANKPNEFGKLVQVQEAENQIRLIVERHSHPTRVHSPLLYPALRQAPGHLYVSRQALLVPAQVLQERLALTGFSDGKHLVHRWGGDPVAALPEVLRMAVGQVGLVPFDTERLKRPQILRERPRAAESGVEVVDLLDGKHN